MAPIVPRIPRWIEGAYGGAVRHVPSLPKSCSVDDMPHCGVTARHSVVSSWMQMHPEIVPRNYFAKTPCLVHGRSFIRTWIVCGVLAKLLHGIVDYH